MSWDTVSWQASNHRRFVINKNLLVTEAAKLLKPMLEELVFVGGCTTALLITDEAARSIEPIVHVTHVVSPVLCDARRLSI
jgi:hypothetical protein